MRQAPRSCKMKNQKAKAGDPRSRENRNRRPAIPHSGEKERSFFYRQSENPRRRISGSIEKWQNGGAGKKRFEKKRSSAPGGTWGPGRSPASPFAWKHPCKHCLRKSERPRLPCLRSFKNWKKLCKVTKKTGRGGADPAGPGADGKTNCTKKWKLPEM